VTRFALRKKFANTAVKTFSIPQAVLLGISGVLSALAAISPTQAATVTSYTNRAAFTAASNSLINIGFEELAPAGSYTYYPSPGLAQVGVNFASSDSNLFVVDPAYAPTYYDWGSGAVLLGNKLGSTITATLPTGVTAIGSDIFSIIGYASDFVVSLSSGDTFTFNSFNYPNPSFAGLISDTPISSITFKAVNGFTEIDNFTFGKANTQPVPEPLTILGTLTAAGFGVTLRRKQKQQQTARVKA
jgi:hypothetical protein